MHHLGYGEKIKEITPYLNGVMRTHLQYSQLDGVILPIDEKTAYKRGKKITQFQDLFPDESNFNAYLVSLGITAKVSTKKSFKGKVVALGGGNAYNFTKAQLKSLFADNYVIVDGGAARILIDRGLGYLIRASAYQMFWGEHDVHSYEQVRDGILINGKPGYRVTAFGKSGNYVKITYDNEQGAQSFVYDYNGNQIGIGDMDGGNFFVIPYVIDTMYMEQYHDLRTELLKTFLRKTQAELVLTNHAGVCAYLYRQKTKKVLIVVNSTEEDFDRTVLELQGIHPTKIYAIHRKNGRKVRVSYEKQGTMVAINTKNTHLTTQTFVIYE